MGFRPTPELENALSYIEGQLSQNIELIEKIEQMNKYFNLLLALRMEYQSWKRKNS